MPKVMPVVLCVVLFQVYPKILQVALTYAEKNQRPSIVYVMLITATVLFVGLIVLYMFLAYSGKPTGLEDLLRKFADILKTNDAAPKLPKDRRVSSCSKKDEKR